MIEYANPHSVEVCSIRADDGIFLFSGGPIGSMTAGISDDGLLAKIVPVRMKYCYDTTRGRSWEATVICHQLPFTDVMFLNGFLRLTLLNGENLIIYPDPVTFGELLHEVMELGVPASIFNDEPPLSEPSLLRLGRYWVDIDNEPTAPYELE